MCQQIRTRYRSISYTQVQWDVLYAFSKQKARRRSERPESEERRWTVTRDLENYVTRYTWRPTHKRLDCSDPHPSLQNVNVTIDFSPAEHRNWWRWNVKSFKRKEIAWYTWRSSTHQHNFLKVYDKVGSRAKHEENPEQLHARQQSKRVLVEYSLCRSHQRNDAIEIARIFFKQIVCSFVFVCSKKDGEWRESAARVIALEVWLDILLKLMITCMEKDNETETVL